MKKLREKCKNKKGFTMVELIVVIVIILVLAAVMVPSLLKYIEKANQANCKSDAATALVQLQADVADYYSDMTNTTAFEPKKIGNIEAEPGNATSKPSANHYQVAISADMENRGEITAFAFANAKYYITWSKDAGWKDVQPLN